MSLRRAANAALCGLTVLALAACDDTTPFGNVDEVDGVYAGTWSLQWATNNPNINPPGSTSLCTGSITLGNQRDDRFDGTFLINADGGCIDGSPVSGAVRDGRVRTDTGVNFTMLVPPTLGEVKTEDDIWEDIYAGSAIILPDLILGCVIIDADNQMNGALAGRSLAASASAAIQCPRATGGSVGVQLQIRFDGAR